MHTARWDGVRFEDLSSLPCHRVIALNGRRVAPVAGRQSALRRLLSIHKTRSTQMNRET